MAIDPALQKLLAQRRQAVGAGNEKRFSNLTNKIREARGASPLSDAQKAKMFQNKSAKFGGQPDNTTFNRRPLPGGGKIMTGPQQIQGPNAGQLAGLSGIPEVMPNQGGPTPKPYQGRPLPGGGRIMFGPQQIQGPNVGQPAGLSGVPGRAVAFKNGGAVVKNAEKKKKKNVNGIAKRGTKFKGVF